MVIAKTRLETLQACKLLQCVRRRDLAQIIKLVTNGVPGLLDYNDPAASADNDNDIDERNPNEPGDTALTLAAGQDDLELVEFLLRLGAHPDAGDLKGRTALSRAAERGNVECMRRLLESSANASAVDVDGKGVLFYCLTPSERHLECARLALSHGADVNARCHDNKTDGGITVLQAACCDALNIESICLLLLEYGAESNCVEERETGICRTRTALMAACAAGSQRVVSALLERGAHVDDFVERTGTRSVHEAARAGQVMILQLLAAYGADMNVIDIKGNTPMHLAAENGRTVCCKFLAQRGCNPKTKNREGLTAHTVAKRAGRRQAAKECRKAESVYGTPSQKVTPTWAVALYDYCYHRREHMFDAFESIDGDQTGRVDRQFVVEVLTEVGAPLPADSTDIGRLLAVHESKEKGPGIDYVEFLSGKKYIGKQYLVEVYDTKSKKRKKKKKKKRRGRRGKGKKGRRTRVPVAVCTRPEGPRAEDGGPPAEFVPRQFPLTDNSRFDYYSDNDDDDEDDESSSDDEGDRTARPPHHYLEDDSWWYLPAESIDYMRLNDAVRHADFNTVQGAIIDKGREAVDQRDRFYKTPLMVAASAGNVDVVQFLLNNGADVNASDNFKWTPLHFACRSGQPRVVELLLTAEASINAVTFGGATPLMRAVESGRPEVVRLMLERGADIRPVNRKGKTVVDLAAAYGDQRVYALIKDKWKSMQPKKKAPKSGSVTAVAAQNQ